MRCLDSNNSRSKQHLLVEQFAVDFVENLLDTATVGWLWAKCRFGWTQQLLVDSHIDCSTSSYSEHGMFGSDSLCRTAVDRLIAHLLDDWKLVAQNWKLSLS